MKFYSLFDICDINENQVLKIIFIKNNNFFHIHKECVLKKATYPEFMYFNLNVTKHKTSFP